MEFRLSQAIGEVKLALMDAAASSSKRRLSVLNIKCEAGCSACCSRLLTITIAEAVVIHEYLVQTKQWGPIRDLCFDQAKITRNINNLAWFKMNIKCPILDRQTNLCKAYKFRPAACSIHFVTSSPRLCDPWTDENGRYEAHTMTDIFETFSKKLNNTVDGFGIFSLSMTLPLALLVAERIQVQSGLDIQKTISLLFNELK